jgi:hypothetical protein
MSKETGASSADAASAGSDQSLDRVDVPAQPSSRGLFGQVLGATAEPSVGSGHLAAEWLVLRSWRVRLGTLTKSAHIEIDRFRYRLATLIEK